MRKFIKWVRGDAGSASPRYVMAHFILGNSTHMSVDDWRDDIQLAQSSGIDAFGLNVALLDGNNEANFGNAFAAAEGLGSAFKLYLTIDYLAWGRWDAASVIELLRRWAASPAYFRYRDRPLVSTFEGTANIHDWVAIKLATDCFFVPDWSSLGPAAAAEHLGSIADGLAGWKAWPDGPGSMTVREDEGYIDRLAGRPYMIPVSPCFYTNLPQHGKNWLWRSDGLWHDRWEQVIALADKAPFVQIISWNDYGESHYICPIRKMGVPDGAWYVDGQQHQGWLALLPHYIAAYKTGRLGHLAAKPSATQDGREQLVLCYRLHPARCGSADGTTGNNASYQTAFEPHQLATDAVQVSVLLDGPAEIRLRIGPGPPDVLRARRRGLGNFHIPFAGRSGPVTAELHRAGRRFLHVDGPAITTDCAAGRVNWNPVTVHAST